MGQLISFPGNSGPVNPGERRVIEELIRRLPDDYQVVPNVEIGDNEGQPFEYDAIVIAPHAVYVIETKDWWGDIAGDAVEWLVNGTSRRSPMIATRLKAKVLKSKISNHMPGLGRVWVEPVVVLSSNPSSLQLAPDARRGVFLLADLCPFLTDPSAINQRAEGIADLRGVIQRAMRPKLRPRNGPLKFGDYEVIELLEQSDDESWYRARRRLMPGAPNVRLRVVTLSRHSLSEHEYRERRAALFRETEALLRMGVHPNVIATRDVFEDEHGRIIAVLDESEGRTLRQRLKDGTPLTVEQRMQILVDVCSALVHAHTHDVIHRQVQPDSILLSEDGTTRLGRFGLAKLQIENTVTVWHPDSDADIDVRYTAPELLNPAYGLPSPASDLYGLGCVGYELFAGHPPFSSPTDAFRAPPAMPDGMPEGLRGLVPELLVGHPAQRMNDTKDVLVVLQEIDTSGRARSATGPKSVYEPGDLIDGKFEVQAELGGGGFSTVYRVYRALDDREYALKVFNTEVPYEKVQREIMILNTIANPHIVRVVWGDKTRAGQWYLVSELVQGETLADYAYGEKQLSPEESVRLMDQLLRALEVIHPDEARLDELRQKADLTEEEYAEIQAPGIVHRDIKPQNLMLTARGVVLIDFNIASQAGSKVQTISGTPRYLAPDIIAGIDTWDVSPDLFAVGVVLYELLCAQHPYQDGQPRFDHGPVDPREFRPDLSPAIADFLVKACAPYRDSRFKTAKEMREALESIDELILKAPSGSPKGELPASLADLIDNAPPNINPMVSQFLALSSQARHSNRGTRGMDDLARATYVTTGLDKALSDTVLAGKHSLVIITGNAGDGKTAFIQQVEEAARSRGAEMLQQTVNGNRLRIGSLEIITLYDGSQDEEDRTSDEILFDFFAPVVFDQRPKGTARLAAINEGRLRDFLIGHRDLFEQFTADVIAVLDDPARSFPTPDVVIVNLNLRSVTTGGEKSIFSRQLHRIVDGPFWGPCETCDYRVRCPIKHNVDTFRDPTCGPVIAERLRVLVDLIRLRRRRHLTMRDVRSLLSHILFRDRTCVEIADMLSTSDPLAIVDVTYFQGPGGRGTPAGSSVERNAALLTEVDVALVANPTDDWALAHGEGPLRMSLSTRESEYPSELIADTRERAGQGYDADVELARLAHQAARRQTYFERSDEGWWGMLPYQQLPALLDAMEAVDTKARERLRRRVVRAVSVFEGLPDRQLADDALWVATNDEPSDSFRCFRRFPVEEFELRIQFLPTNFIEYEPDHLELVHTGGATLDLDVDLVEILDRLEDGYLPTMEEAQGFLINLELFRHRLLAQPAAELLVVQDGRLLVIQVGEELGTVELKEASA